MSELPVLEANELPEPMASIVVYRHLANDCTYEWKGPADGYIGISTKLLAASQVSMLSEMPWQLLLIARNSRGDVLYYQRVEYVHVGECDAES